jgi:hypothetical protein
MRRDFWLRTPSGCVTLEIVLPYFKDQIRGSMPRRRRNRLVRFTQEERVLLARYLLSYRRLAAGRLPANTAARRRFVAVAKGRLPPVAIHEVAFVKWLMAEGLRPYAPVGFAPVTVEAVTLTAPRTAPGGPAVATPALSERLRSGARNFAETAHARGRDGWSRAADWFNATLATDLAPKLDAWLRDSFAAGKATIYDKAMDAVHIVEPSGPFHRLWDGGHSLTDAWKAVRDASPDDTFAQEVSGYLSAIWKDVITPMGLPVATIDRTWFESSAAALGDFGITKKELADALSYTGTEVAGAALGLVALLLNWNKAETEKAAALAGSLGISTLFAANPVLGLVTLACFARAFQTARSTGARSALAVGVVKGGAGSAVLIAASAIVGGPVWVGILAGILASILIQNAIAKGADHLAAVDWAALWDRIVRAFRSGTDAAGMLLLKPA